MEVPKWIWIPLLIIGIGAILQTFRLLPTILDKEFDIAASKLTVAAIFFVLSGIFLLFFLQQLLKSNREGFQGETAIAKWKEMANKYQIVEVCNVKDRIREKMIQVEKGGGDKPLSEEQASETVEKTFEKGTLTGSVNCAIVKKVDSAADMDGFFTAIQEVSDNLLVQTQETIEGLVKLLDDQNKKIDDALQAKNEAFIDMKVGICSPEVVEERRKFLREKKLDEEAERCLLPEEVPFESKDAAAKTKIQRIQETYDSYIRTFPQKLTIGELLQKAKDAEDKLNKRKQEAESGALLNSMG